MTAIPAAFESAVLRKLHANPALLDHLSIPPLALSPGREIAERREIIRRVYSLPRYGEILGEIYDRACGGAVGKVSHLSTQKVLAQFLHPSRLNLRTAATSPANLTTLRPTPSNHAITTNGR